MILAPFRGRVWRILDQRRADRPDAPATAPEGRFHHDGQSALYASLSAEGAGIAIARYVSPGDLPRRIVPLDVCLARVRDLRLEAAPARASVIWQDIRESGAPSPTWAWSDAARAAGAEAMIYLSRSRPDLAHMVLFDWAAEGALRQAGPALHWPPVGSS